ncbi:388_t:CDS:2 [Rhizophagus irregularis]|nr:388_t:CDS:2 [Rhizophagus irregularis]
MSDQAKQATQRAADAIVQKQTHTSLPTLPAPRPLLRPPLPALPALPTPAPAILVLINPMAEKTRDTAGQSAPYHCN